MKVVVLGKFYRGSPLDYIQQIFSYLVEGSMKCAEANFFHNGFDRIDGIFFDTGSTRGVKNFGQEAADADIQSHVELVSNGDPRTA